MKLVLYTAALSRGFMVEWLLEELEAPYTRVDLDLSADEHKSERYLAIHPLGAVPALVVDDRPMFESLAICLYLADAFTEAGLAPGATSPERAAYCQWMVYATATVEPKLGPAFVRSLSVAAEDRAQVATDDERAAMESVLAPLRVGLERGHLLDSGFSAADVVLASELHWASQVGLLTSSPAAERYLSALTARPAFEHGVESA